MTDPRRLWKRFTVAYAANITADRLVDVTVPLLALIIAGNISLAGVYVAFFSIGRMLIGPLLSQTIKKLSHVYWSSIANILQAVILGIFAGIILITEISIPIIAIIGFGAGVGSGLFAMVTQPTVRAIVPKERFFKANSHLEIIDSIFTLLVPVCAGFLSDTLGPSYGIAIGSLVLAFAGALRWGMPTGRYSKHQTGEPTTHRERRTSWVLTRLAVVAIPFTGGLRRFVSVNSIVLLTVSTLLVPIASYRIHELGGGGASVGISVSAAGAGGIIAAILAGHFQRFTASVRLNVLLITVATIVIPAMLIMPNIALVALLVFVCDAVASWLYVALPTYRMATETDCSLVDVSSGMLTTGSLASVFLGALLAKFGSAPALYWLVLVACAVLLVAVFSSFAAGNTSRLQTILRPEGQEAS